MHISPSPDSWSRYTARLLPALGSLALIVSPTRAQYDANAPEPLSPLKGTLVIGGGGSLPDTTYEHFVDLAGGDEAELVVITDTQPVSLPSALEDATLFSLEDGNASSSTAVAQALSNATGVWLLADDAFRLADRIRATPLEMALQAVVQRAGVIGSNGEAARVLTRIAITGGEQHATLGVGLDLLPSAVLDVGFDLDADRNRLLGVLASHPHLVGLGVEPATVLVLHRRFIDVLGEGSVYACLAGSERSAVRIEEVNRRVSPRAQRRGVDREATGAEQGSRRGSRANDSVALSARERRRRPYRPRRLEDLVAMSRAAQARIAARFPAVNPPAPHVAQGTLILIGGGALPAGFQQTFIELAGGKDALILYIPCTENEVANVDGTLARWRAAGATNVDYIHTKDRMEADTSEEIHDKLRRAGGLFFGGGRQWNLVDSWQHTEAHRLMHGVLERGGVIAGSSAGASIQSSYMPRGSSLGNLDPMAEGYESGLGFLTGVAVDQHFAQRERFGDMTALVDTYPQLLGIGLDEGSAVLVEGSLALSLGGKGCNVHVYDRRRPVIPGEPDYITLVPGQTFDLAKRKLARADATPPRPVKVPGKEKADESESDPER